MILKALVDYYNNCNNLSPYGFEWKEIPFIIVIDKDGQFIDIEDTRDGKNTQKFLVLKGSRTSGIIPYVMYDNNEYVLNYTGDTIHLEALEQQKEEGSAVDEKKIEKLKSKLENSRKKHEAFVAKCKSIAEQCADDEILAVSKFFGQNQLEALKAHPVWSEMVKIMNKNTQNSFNISFRLKGQCDIIASNKALISELSDKADDNKPKSICLVTGEPCYPILISTATRIPGGSQTTTKLVAFQVSSGYDSYGKTQCENAPISPEVDHAFTSALKSMLAKDSKNKLFIGNRTFVFWSSSKSEASLEMQNAFFSMCNPASIDDNQDPNSGLEQVINVLKGIYSGNLKSDSTDRFYFLGLAPNSARIAVVYWNECSIRDLAKLLLSHFDDMEIVDNRKMKKPYRGLYSILAATTISNKQSDALPNLPEALLKAILQGTRYPISMYQAVLRRIKAEQDISIVRAAIIKAYINRLITNEIKLKVMLDKENNNQGYLCGRLFAVLEYIQERSNGIHTIRERYMNAASSTPSAVFSTLLNLSVHHVENLSKSDQIFFENLKMEIISKLTSNGYPAHLDMQDQGRFMVGYYHQRQDFYTKKTKETSTEE